LASHGCLASFTAPITIVYFFLLDSGSYFWNLCQERGSGCKERKRKRNIQSWEQWSFLYLCSDHGPLYVSSSEDCLCVHGKVGSLVSLRLFDFFLMFFYFRLLAYSVAACHQKATAGLRAIACGLVTMMVGLCCERIRTR